MIVKAIKCDGCGKMVSITEANRTQWNLDTFGPTETSADGLWLFKKRLDYCPACDKLLNPLTTVRG